MQQPYLPSFHTREQENQKPGGGRINQDTWDLVGDDQTITDLRRHYETLVYWAETPEQQELISSFERLISEYEITLYDKLN